MSSEAINAREASMSRVQTQESVLASLAVEPTPVATEGLERNESNNSVKNQDEQHQDKPVKKTAQERISELANKRREAETRADEATKRASELEARLKALEAAAPPAEVSDKPNRAQFTNDEQYIEALTDWKATEAIIKREQQQAQARFQAEIDEVNAQYEVSLKAAQERYTDFVEVVSAATTNIPDFLVMAIKESPIGADLTYYLSMHKDEAEKLASMRPVKAIKYLDQLERDLLSDDEPVKDKTEGKSAPVTKKPPAPIAPLAGSAAIAPNQAKSFDEYKARRLAAKKLR